MGSETDGTELDCTNGHLDDEALKEVPITDDLVVSLKGHNLKIAQVFHQGCASGIEFIAGD